MSAVLQYERLGSFTDRQVIEQRALEYCRWLQVLHRCDGAPLTAVRHYVDTFPRSPSRELIEKAAIPALGLDDVPFVGPRVLSQAFVSLITPQTILGKLEASVRHVPFNVGVPVVVTGATFAWVSEKFVKPVSELDLTSVKIPPAKAAGIIAVTKELMLTSGPIAERALRDSLRKGLTAFLDQQLVDPAVAPVAGTSPGSITNGITPIASAGPTAANALADLVKLVKTFATAYPNVETAVIILSPSNAVALAASGKFADLRVDGGTLAGMPAIVSAAAGTNVVMTDPSSLLVADDGDLEITISTSATLQMNSTPDNPPTASTVYVSLWDNNLVGLRCERIISWQRASNAAVAYVSGANYTGA